jgi:hypothetical protein
VTGSTVLTLTYPAQALAVSLSMVAPPSSVHVNPDDDPLTLSV